MKKMIAFLLCGGLLLAGKNLPNRSFDLFENAEKMIVVSEKRIEQFDDEFISGNDYYYTFQAKEIEKNFSILDEKDGIKGLNLYFNQEMPLSYFQNKLDFLGDETNLGENKIYYGYYSYYKHFKWIDGKKINVQLVQTAEGWILGMPLILTGF